MKGSHQSRCKPTAPTLSCESVELWLTAHPERCDRTEREGASLPHFIEQHLSTCARCREEWDGALSLSPILLEAGPIHRHERFTGGRLGPEGSDELFVRGVMAQVREELPPIRRRESRARWRRRGAAAAATVVFGLGLFALYGGTGSGRSLGADLAPLGADLARQPSVFPNAFPSGSNESLPFVVDPIEGNPGSPDFGFIPAISATEDGAEIVKF